MFFSFEKEKIKDYSCQARSNAAAILWLIGTTFAAFLLYVVIQALLFGILPSVSSAVSDIALYGSIAIPLFLPATILYWKKIRLGKTATGILTVLCSVSLIIDLLFIGLAYLLRLISGLFPHANLFLGWVVETSILLIFVIFVRISLLISLLTNSENPKRSLRVILLSLSILEIVLLAFFIFSGLEP